MAGIQLRLQKELFTPCDEQLLSLVHCFKALGADKKSNKSNRDIFLCLISDTSNQPGYQVIGILWHLETVAEQFFKKAWRHLAST
jgi:hypothetical protein